MSDVSRNTGGGRAGLAPRGATDAHRRRLARISAAFVAAGAAVAMTAGCSASVNNAPPRPTSGDEPVHNVAVAVAGLATLGHLKPPPPPGDDGPEQVPVPAAPLLAAPGREAKGQPIDHIQCEAMEQGSFHIHAHLTIFVNGSPRRVPAGIGIPGAQAQHTLWGTFITGGNCYYWLHTHAADGIIHTESPVGHIYTLGQFFDIWGQPLTSRRVGPAIGHVTAFYNQKVYRGNPRDIPLNRVAQVQLEVGKPRVAPETITWPYHLAHPSH